MPRLEVALAQVHIRPNVRTNSYLGRLYALADTQWPDHEQVTASFIARFTASKVRSTPCKMKFRYRRGLARVRLRPLNAQQRTLAGTEQTCVTWRALSGPWWGEASVAHQTPDGRPLIGSSRLLTAVLSN